MPDISGISHYPLKMIFAIHMVLVTWGMQGYWCPKSAMFYNLLFFICLLWAVHNVESDEPLQFALFINVLSIFLDIVTLSLYFPTNPLYASDKFSAAFMIINLIVRAVTSIYLLRIGQARGGSLATMFTPCPAMGISRQDYEDISHPIPQNSDFVGI
ncbi:hypothetical protein KPH14_001920 [Odynerus spinipes]|uniref:Type-1 angiotensin II receptor-associated protein n=1 Tax=Odynerus spinipes TaxID=1348599 RepID=A0AAD9S041_9HYME|nr:hypothetical protein KPH14_001920 [Odynerus spinipes]